ncbi:MAG: hypothetical protein HPY53_09725 [Brevinematales bacterium]|nr:hypothetical protein [Brevinematales bacterium]
MKQVKSLLLILLFALTAGACQKSTQPGVIPPMPEPAFTDAGQKSDHPSPGLQIHYIVGKINEGKEKEVDSFVLYTLDMQAEAILSKQPNDWSAKDKANFWKEFTKNKSITRIEILSEKVAEDYAIVWFRIYFKDGSFNDKETEMHWNGAQWLMMAHPTMLK